MSHPSLLRTNFNIRELVGEMPLDGPLGKNVAMRESVIKLACSLIEYCNPRTNCSLLSFKRVSMFSYSNKIFLSTVTSSFRNSYVEEVGLLEVDPSAKGVQPPSPILGVEVAVWRELRCRCSTNTWRGQSNILP